MKKHVSILILSLALSACGTLQTLNESATFHDTLNVATLYAIEQSRDRTARAIAIIKAAEELRTFIDFNAVTLDELVDRARLRIARSDSELSEKAGLTLLLNRAERLLRDRVAAGELDPGGKATVNELLDAIIASARAYAG